jgi:hypothetical protein
MYINGYWCSFSAGWLGYVQFFGVVFTLMAGFYSVIRVLDWLSDKLFGL